MRSPKSHDLPPFEEKIEEIDVSSEMRGSFLEYAYSVIYTRALPDARDGLKPVQRRILFQMDQMGLRPDRGHVKSSRVIGEVMGKLHPHGDTAIYDALVRLAQDFNLRVPLVDGHGNFGSLDDGPAAPRYTEARLAASALALTGQLDEDTVDFVPNYDNQFQQPEVLPAAFPNLLVNGASGIAVGMATNIAPHNPSEALAGALHLLQNPDATTEDLMRFIPGPDFPGGGIVNDLASVREAYETGRGSFKVRAKVQTERVSARKTGLVVTELPYMVGPERVIEKIKDSVSAGRIKGISAVTNLTDRKHGLRLVIDIKAGFNPMAVLAQLYRQTPLEEAFSMNAVALVHGQPRQLTLRDMLKVFVDHRLELVRRRTEFRLNKQQARLHLVEGLLRAILDIDDVIAIIRSAEDAAAAQERLMVAFDLSERQAEYILELRLRRLTKFSRLELETEQQALLDDIARLQQILASPRALADNVAEEMRQAATALASPRRTVLQDGEAVTTAEAALESAGSGTAMALEIPDEPCLVVLSATGALARISGTDPLPLEPQADNSIWRQYAASTTRSQIAVVTEDGMAHRVDVVSLPSLLRSPGGMSLATGVPVKDLLGTVAAPIAVFSLADPPVIALGTERGVVKRVRPEHPGKDSWTVLSLDSGDRVIGGGVVSNADDLVFVTAGTQLLRIKAEGVRPQGTAAGGMAGIKLGDGDRVIFFGVVDPVPEATVVTVAQAGGTLEGTAYSSIKLTALAEYPYKGRATQGVRCQRLLRGEDSLGMAWVGPHLPRGAGSTGHAVALPERDPRRDGSGSAMKVQLSTLG